VKQLAFDLIAPASPTLDNFVAGERNVELLQRLMELAHSARREQSLYLWGAPVSGRTHLLRGTLHALDRAGWRTFFCAGPVEVSCVPGEFDAVAVDDVQRLDDAGQRSLFNLYNHARDAGALLLTAGDAPPGSLKLRADVVTRLAWGLVYEVHALTDEEKLQALARHAGARGFQLSMDVAEYVLSRVPRDMRTLMTIIDALDRYGLEAHRPITLPLAREMLNLDPGIAVAAAAAREGGA
jgi:DnaA family protein